ncbi:MAG: hypothetical protein R3B81_14215 [bacterium]
MTRNLVAAATGLAILLYIVIGHDPAESRCLDTRPVAERSVGDR